MSPANHIVHSSERVQFETALLLSTGLQLSQNGNDDLGESHLSDYPAPRLSRRIRSDDSSPHPRCRVYSPPWPRSFPSAGQRSGRVVCDAPRPRCPTWTAAIRCAATSVKQRVGDSTIADGRRHGTIVDDGTLQITCGSDIVTIVGIPGNDTLNGTPGRDVIDGLGGNSTIDGLGGNDVLCGGAGNDILTGGAGDDTLFGGPGRDRLNGGPGNDRLIGGDGTDRLRGDSGDDASPAALARTPFPAVMATTARRRCWQRRSQRRCWQKPLELWRWQGPVPRRPRGSRMNRSCERVIRF